MELCQVGGLERRLSRRGRVERYLLDGYLLTLGLLDGRYSVWTD